MKHKYKETRSIHYYQCGNCDMEFTEVDGCAEYYEEMGPAEYELECPHCETEADVEMNYE